MVRAGDGYELRIAALERSFKYRVSAGPAVSRAYSVTALHPVARPAHRAALRLSVVQRAEAARRDRRRRRLRPGRHARAAGRAHRQAGGHGRARVLRREARRCRWRASTTGRSSPRSRSRRKRPTASASSIPDGLTSEGIEYFVRVMDDRPPDVHILRPSGDTQITLARGSPDRGARRRRLRHRQPRHGLFGERRRGEGRAVHDARRHQPRAHRIADAGGRRSAREARRRHRLLRARARHPARQAVDAVAQRDLLPRGEAVQRGVHAGAEPGDVDGREHRAAARRADLVAEGDHQRDLESRAAGERGTFVHRHQERRRRAGGAERTRGAGGRRARASGAGSGRSRRSGSRRTQEGAHAGRPAIPCATPSTRCRARSSSCRPRRPPAPSRTRWPR